MYKERRQFFSTAILNGFGIEVTVDFTSIWATRPPSAPPETTQAALTDHPHVSKIDG
jgi:hypothetical protein